MKTCKKCQVAKEITEFHKHRAVCKECKNALGRMIKVNHPERYKKYQERGKWYKKERLYGINQQEYLQILENQGNKCAICSNTFKNTKDTHVDHCHTTNKVRGILCNYCNISLGKFKDNVEYLRAAIEYLR